MNVMLSSTPPQQIENIANSIKEFGFRQPIVIDNDNVIIIGHGRCLAAQKLQMESVPCIRASDLNEAQIMALRLADNKTNESGWDFDMLDVEMKAISDMKIDFDVGFNMRDFGFGSSIDDERDTYTYSGEDDDDDEYESPEALSLDDDSGYSATKDTVTCHCPKCGFVFEVKK